MKKLVSISHVITNLMDDLNLDHNKYRPMFINWATRAEKQISSWYQYKRKIAVLDIEGCVANLPCDAAILELALVGDYGCDCYDLFTRIGLSAAVTVANTEGESFFVVDAPAVNGESAFTNSLIPHHVQDNKIIFGSNLDGLKVTVQYRGIEVDSEGIPKVMDSHLEAIGEYCMFKWRSRNIKSYLEKSICNEHEQRWHRYCAAARGDDAELTEAERQQIAGMLNNPLAGRGLNLLHHTL